MPSLAKLILQTYRMAQPRERRVVLHNAASLSVLQVITYILPLLIIPYLFRILGPNKFGLIAFAQAFVQYFLILTNYGFNISATREISLCRDNPARMSRTFSSVMIVKMSLALLSLSLFSLLVFFIPRFKTDWLIYVLSSGTILGAALFPTWFFQGTEKMKYITDLNVACGVIGGMLVLLLVRRPQDYLLVPLINSVAIIATGLWGQFIAVKEFRIALRPQARHHIRQQLRAGWDVFISVAAINAYTTARVFVLGLLTNNQVTGFYSIAERIAGAFQTFPLDSFSQAIFPRLSKIFQKNKTKALCIMQRIQRITVILSAATLSIIILLARPIVTIVCGGDYPETILTLKLLLVAVFFVCANAFRVQFLLVCGKSQIYSRIHVVMALIGLPLIFLLIASFSYMGAAVATVAVEVGVFTVTFFTVRNLRFSK